MIMIFIHTFYYFFISYISYLYNNISKHFKTLHQNHSPVYNEYIICVHRKTTSNLITKYDREKEKLALFRR